MMSEESLNVVDQEEFENRGENRNGRITYRSEGLWFSRMIITYRVNGVKIRQVVEGSGAFVDVPSSATQVKVKFQVRRPFWGDIMKYNRFTQEWVRPEKNHVFTYTTPPYRRTFTIRGILWWESVDHVVDETEEETREMEGYRQER